MEIRSEEALYRCNKYPEDSIQACTEQWWIVDSENKNYERRRLIEAYIPHVDQIPYQLIPTGRTKPTEHNYANVIIEPLNIKKQPPKKTKLPVAAMPSWNNNNFQVTW